MSFWNESRVLKIIAHCSVGAIVWMYRHRDTRRCPPILLLITLKPIVVRFVLKLLFEPMHNVNFCNFQSGTMEILLQLQAFLDFRNFRFNVVYNSIIFSSPLVLLSNLDLRRFWFSRFFMCPHINSVKRGMPVFPCLNYYVKVFALLFWFWKFKSFLEF